MCFIETCRRIPCDKSNFRESPLKVVVRLKPPHTSISTLRCIKLKQLECLPLFQIITRSLPVPLFYFPGDSATCKSKDHCFSFHLTQKLFKHQVIDFATLQFFKSSDNSLAHKVTLEDNDARGRIIARNRLPVVRDWVSLRVEQQIKRWVKGRANLNKTQSFRMSCEDCPSESEFKVSNKSRYRPFLLIKTTEKKYKRLRKRRSFSVDCIPGYFKCCRQSFFVTFNEIDWGDWIIEPSGFVVSTCKGNCAGDNVYAATSHSFVKKQLKRSKANAFFALCCVPTKFSTLTLLHFDEDGFIFKTVLDNMIVTECGCM